MNTEKEYEKWYNSLTVKQIEDYESDYNRYKSIMESGDEDMKMLKVKIHDKK